MLQRIRVGVNDYNIVFDSRCGDLVSKKSAVDRLGRDAQLEVPSSSSSSFIYLPLVDTYKIAIVFYKNEKCTKIKI